MLDVRWNVLNLNPKKKYLIYFIGNFSPPHKGHMDLIAPYFNKKRIKILIHVWGDEKRHGISLRVTLDILNIYLKNVDNVKIEKYDSNFSIKKIDFLVFIRGNENFNSSIKNTFLDNHEILIKNLRQKGIQSILFFRDRIPKISSTEMCLSEDKKIYLPEYITEEEKLKILEILKNTF